jgi:glutamate synthase (NADPH/NADH) small chain
LNKKGSILIGALERFAADKAKIQNSGKIKKKKQKIAVVGSGPAGLSCAYDLTLNGYSVTIYEALHDVGGVLRYGIPSFRLPKRIIDSEIEDLINLGIKVETNVAVGKTITLDELEKSYDAVFVGTGAGLPKFMGIPGENLRNVYSSNEFLTRVNLMQASDFPNYLTPIKKAKNVIVVGGGNTAIDSARVALRLGANVTLVYRRSVNEMPARNEEVRHAREEGIQFLLLTNPKKILGKDSVEGMECMQMMLGVEDDSGRRAPIAIEDSEFVIPCDMVIMAIGQNPNPLLVKNSNLRTTFGHKLIVDDRLQTSHIKVFAGGDAIPGKDTVIRAMGDGKRAAASIHEMLSRNE